MFSLKRPIRLGIATLVAVVARTTGELVVTNTPALTCVAGSNGRCYTPNRSASPLGTDRFKRISLCKQWRPVVLDGPLVPAPYRRAHDLL